MNREIQDLIFTIRGIYATTCIRHINVEITVLYRNRYPNIQSIYRNSYTLLYWCNFPYSHRFIWMNKREYELHVFIEALYDNIPESYSKIIQNYFVLYSPVFCPNLGEYGAKKTYWRWFYVVLVQNIVMLHLCFV